MIPEPEIHPMSQPPVTVIGAAGLSAKRASATSNVALTDHNNSREQVRNFHPDDCNRSTTGISPIL